MRYSRSVLYNDKDNSFDALANLCDMSEVTKIDELKREHTEIVKSTLASFTEGQKFGSPQVLGKKFFETVRIFQKYRAKIPVNILRYFRAISTRESVILHLYPEMELQDMATIWRNYSIVSIVEEIPRLLSVQALDTRLLRFINFVEKELISV